MVSTPTPIAHPLVAEGVARLDGSCFLGREAIGGKAWSINAMRALGLPVPPAVALTTASCAAFFAAGSKVPEAVWEQIVDGVAFLEKETGRQFGGSERPLLVSVRSGAAVSMPGMMDTVLNLGLTDAVARALADETGNEAYVVDTRARFARQYRETVLHDDHGEVPDDPWTQLRCAVAAVFASWQSPRARTYRRTRGIDAGLGTAVTIQAMVFGNLDELSGTGVLFSRNPNTGEQPAWGEWLSRGQGEDVVSGRVTPQPLSHLAEIMPEVHEELLEASRRLELRDRDLQDIEFTVESGRLWLLQSRSAKRSPRAAVRTAVAMVEEGLLSESEATSRVSAEQVRSLLVPALAGIGHGEPLVTGEPASPGWATGVVVTDPDEAEERGEAGEDVILVRATTSPEDLHGMVGARGIVTEYGGATSHAAVVSREIGRPCVVGCGAGSMHRLTGRVVTVDGSSGRVWEGVLLGATVDESVDEDLARLTTWAAADAPLAVRLRSEVATLDEVVDLDAAGEGWRRALRAGVGVRGSVLETDEGIQAAVDAGVAFVVVERRIPALLAALQHARSTSRTAPTEA